MNTHAPNRLIHSDSPYLLQHSHNPVNWYPWGKEAFEIAQKENKLLLISIGYSACHWCHVMERESFENEQVASLMNQLFINIKVDREERPDVDQIYMNAVQLITGRGGWPLNCFCLPDGRPIYGGTYFPKQQFMEVLVQLSQMYSQNIDEVLEYANKLENGIKSSEIVTIKQNLRTLDPNFFADQLANFSSSFDLEKGGFMGAPKFPLPNNYDFFFHYLFHFNDNKLENFLKHTLNIWRQSGIYDLVEGGFYRYSVDEDWKIPHFEKMLYDNAQLLSLYCSAYQYFNQDPNYLSTIQQMVHFLKENWITHLGVYSAYDADSEGVEGLYYCFTYQEIIQTITQHQELFLHAYQILPQGNWEHELNVLHQVVSNKLLANKFHLTEMEVEHILNYQLNELKKLREKKVKPALDNKILTSWNAQLVKGLFNASRILNNASIAQDALQIVHNITTYRWMNKKLYRIKTSKTSIGGFLCDYAFYLEALIEAYSFTFDEKYLEIAVEVMNTIDQEFYDQASGMYFYTGVSDDPLIARKQEIMDNVIPASNSVLANALVKLSLITGNPTYKVHAEQIFNNIYTRISKYPSAYSNYLILGLALYQPNYLLVVVNEEKFNEEKVAYFKQYHPNITLAKANKNSPFEPLQKVSDQHHYFLCTANECLPGLQSLIS